MSPVCRIPCGSDVSRVFAVRETSKQPCPLGQQLWQRLGFESGLGGTFSGLRVTQIALGNIVSSQSKALCRQGMTLVLGGMTLVLGGTEQLLQELNNYPKE
ncbi:MAG: hypothetical protein GDA43_23000 [Hormoscilla sp. SP5CHS1]|nr:hypothetical protein [Hormoscilla sp. SP12CHS1]MBC6455695.1 hypothetical protein [Hormoscilla sp. SP5CHS1]